MPDEQPRQQPPSDAGATDDGGVEREEQTPPVTCPPFDPARFHQRMTMDTWLIVAPLLAAFFVLIVMELWRDMGQTVGAGGWLVVLCLIGLWLWTVVRSRQVMLRVPQITMLIDTAPSSAEDMLAAVLSRRVMERPLRWSLYHRLAMLRHRQGRMHEVVAIGNALLRHRIGGKSARILADQHWRIRITRGAAGGSVRNHLLLIMTEAHLMVRDLHGMHRTLCELHRGKLSLVERLQLLALQTRYELASGYVDNVLVGSDEKVHLAEMMPASQAGAMHMMLALAAQRAGQTEFASWLRQRARLLVTDQQLKALVPEAAQTS